MADAIILMCVTIQHDEDGTWSWTAEARGITVMRHEGFHSKAMACLSAHTRKFSPEVKVLWR
jgi:hypothetical protein